MKKLLLFIFLLLPGIVWCQCPSPDFTLSPSVCMGESISIDNNTTGTNSFFWDFCSGELSATPTAQAAASSSSIFRARVFRTVQDVNGNWYGFAIDHPNNTLVRFRFGNSLNNTPTVTNVGNPSSSLRNALDIRFRNEGGNWYALVANTANNNLLRYSFGSNLESVPSVTDLGSFTGVLKGPAGVFVVQDASGIYAVVTNSTSSEVVRLNFGSSITNTPSATAFTVSGSSNLRGISMTRECDRWFGLATSYSTNQLYFIDFATGIGQPPTVGLLNIPAGSPNSYSFPASVSIVNEGAEFYAFVQSAYPGNVYRISFGSSIIDKTGTFTNLGNLGISNDNSAFDVANSGTVWNAFSIDLSGTVTPGAGRLMRLSFPSLCGADVTTSSISSPPVFKYAASGNYKVTLKATGSDGTVGYLSKSITVSTNTSPDINFSSQYVCAGHDVNFTSLNTSGDISTYAWDFGDSGTSESAHPAYRYASGGTYQVGLEVTASTGCKNNVVKSLSIYNPPSADFSLPSVDPICTNQNYIFDNASGYDVALTPTWEWRVNGIVVSADDDLSYRFTNTDDHAIQLRATLPGCESVVSKNIASLVLGPTADFSITGQCEQETIDFTNTSSGNILGYQWDFGDGQGSLADSPAHSYAAHGNYSVTLIASSPEGCNNSVTKTLEVRARPHPDFSLALPPFSCSGTPSQFYDDTPAPSGSNITIRRWAFGDAGSTSNTSTIRNPQHTYANPGNYNVSLEVETNYGCVNTIEKQVTILQAPVANFTFSPACKDVPVAFTDASTHNANSWFWQLGNTFFTTANATYTFASPGSYPVILSVTAPNQCVSYVSKTVVVPEPIAPDFTFVKNCVNQATEFTNVTTYADDPVESTSWSFASLGSASGPTANFSFKNTGDYNVSLTATAASGCSYTITKSVSIVASPVASFSADPQVGVPPLSVQFSNQSSGATHYLWSFNDRDNNASTDMSPSFVFTELGEYVVDLTAYNALNCSHTVSKIIQTVVPYYSASLTNFILNENGDGTVKSIVTLRNDGNTMLENVTLKINVGGIEIREVVPGPIDPNTSLNHLLDFDIFISPNLEYVCASVEIEEDANSEDDVICTSVEKSLIIFAPHPNPTDGPLTLKWISAEEREMTIDVLDMLGRVQSSVSITGVPGLNVMTSHFDHLKAGTYFLRIRGQETVKSYRFLVKR